MIFTMVIGTMIVVAMMMMVVVVMLFKYGKDNKVDDDGSKEKDINDCLSWIFILIFLKNNHVYEFSEYNKMD